MNGGWFALLANADPNAVPPTAPPAWWLREGYWDGIRANITTTLLFSLLFAVVYCVLAALTLRKRSNLLQCLGVGRANPTVRIFVSRIQVRGKDNTDAVEDFIKGYHGPCINKPEYDAAIHLRHLVSFRWLPVFPRRLQQWFAKKYYSVINLEPEIEFAPAKDAAAEVFSEIMSSNLLLIGGNVYNVLSKRVFDSDESILVFMRLRPEEQSVIHKPSKHRYTGRSEGQELAIIQRIRIGRSVVLQCAGIGAGATYEAVQYFKRHWRKHFDRAKGQSFALVLAWEGITNVDEPFHREPDHVFPWYGEGASTP